MAAGQAQLRPAPVLTVGPPLACRDNDLGRARGVHLIRAMGSAVHDELVTPVSAQRAVRAPADVSDDAHDMWDVWSQTLASPELQTIDRALARAAIHIDECVHESARIAEAPATRRRLEEIREVVARLTGPLPDGSFERFVLGHTALHYRQALESAPVSPAVRRLARTGLLRVADGRTRLNLSEDLFVAFSKIATLRRFAAGQFDWERSGLPRSWLAHVRPFGELARLMSIVAFQWRAFRPGFFIHVGVTYPIRALLEREALKSYYRMAQSMALQPDVKGLIASSWLHSPDTFAVTPHLAWLNRVFAEHGAVVATMGPAPPNCGVLARSAERQRAFNEGRFKPTLGLIVWTRRDMLAWAERHPELAS